MYVSIAVSYTHLMGGDGWRNGWMMYWRNADGGIYRATWGETGGNICEPSLKARCV